MPTSITEQRVVVLDFGAQYGQLIARRVRDLHVYSEIVPCDITADELAREYLQEFDYVVEDVQITGSSAQAKVKLSARSVTQVIKDTAAKGDPLHFKRDDLLETLRDAPVQDTEATVYVSKAADGSWDANDGLTLALVKLCF